MSTIIGQHEHSTHGRSPQRDGRIVADRYRLTDRLGTGTLGALHHAVHVSVNKDLIVEIMEAEFIDRQEIKDRFLLGMRKFSRLRHRNIIPLEAFGEDSDGALYIAVERVAGVRLDQLIERRSPLPWVTTRGVVVALADALHAAHRRSLPHGGLTPQVVFIASDPELESPATSTKLYGFGLHEIAVAARHASDAKGATAQVLGDPRYLAPEQFTAGIASVAADIYALGSIAYHLLTGTPPTSGINAFHLLTKKSSEPIRPPADLDPSVPPAVNALIMRALHQQPEERFETIDELNAALEAAPRQALPIAATPAPASAPWVPTPTPPQDQTIPEPVPVAPEPVPAPVQPAPLVTPPAPVVTPPAPVVLLPAPVAARSLINSANTDEESTTMFVRPAPTPASSSPEATVMLTGSKVPAPARSCTNTELLPTHDVEVPAAESPHPPSPSDATATVLIKPVHAVTPPCGPPVASAHQVFTTSLPPPAITAPTVAMSPTQPPASLEPSPPRSLQPVPSAVSLHPPPTSRVSLRLLVGAAFLVMVGGILVGILLVRTSATNWVEPAPPSISNPPQELHR